MGSLAKAAPMNGYMYKRTHNDSSQTVTSASGIYLNLSNGRRILDASCGAAVASIGHGNARVHKAMATQMTKVSYCHPGFFRTPIAEQLANFLVESTGGRMARACILGSGSEAVEAAMKLARQYFLEQDPNSPRHRFIARDGSWHGATLAAMSVGDFKVRKHQFEPLLADNVTRVSACNPYRGRKDGESIEGYVARLAQELDDEFQHVGPETVCAFVAEPVVGTALGCVAPVPSYFQAMKAVCERHGALLIFDEVMCGMGRTGTLHAWEQEGVVPDIQIIGKALGSGYAPISSVLIGHKVLARLHAGSGYFAHGQTYSSFPLSCAAALEVQRIVQERRLCENVRRMGAYLGKQLKQRLGEHPYIGDVRGRGLFWAVEFVRDKASKEPLDSKLAVADRIGKKGLEDGYDISLFVATGTADGWQGDHFMLMPPFTVTREEVDEIVNRAVRVVDAVFKDLSTELAN